VQPRGNSLEPLFPLGVPVNTLYRVERPILLNLFLIFTTCTSFVHRLQDAVGMVGYNRVPPAEDFARLIITVFLLRFNSIWNYTSVGEYRPIVHLKMPAFIYEFVAIIGRHLFTDSNVEINPIFIAPFFFQWEGRTYIGDQLFLSFREIESILNRLESLASFLMYTSKGMPPIDSGNVSMLLSYVRKGTLISTDPLVATRPMEVSIITPYLVLVFLLNELTWFDITKILLERDAVNHNVYPILLAIMRAIIGLEELRFKQSSKPNQTLNQLKEIYKKCISDPGYPGGLNDPDFINAFNRNGLSRRRLYDGFYHIFLIIQVTPENSIIIYLQFKNKYGGCFMNFPLSSRYKDWDETNLFDPNPSGLTDIRNVYLSLLNSRPVPPIRTECFDYKRVSPNCDLFIKDFVVKDKSN
jgi:hypothetical protein